MSLPAYLFYFIIFFCCGLLGLLKSRGGWSSVDSRGSALGRRRWCRELRRKDEADGGRECEREVLCLLASSPRRRRDAVEPVVGCLFDCLRPLELLPVRFCQVAACRQGTCRKTCDGVLLFFQRSIFLQNRFVAGAPTGRFPSPCCRYYRKIIQLCTSWKLWTFFFFFANSVASLDE